MSLSAFSSCFNTNSPTDLLKFIEQRKCTSFSISTGDGVFTFPVTDPSYAAVRKIYEGALENLGVKQGERKVFEMRAYVDSREVANGKWFLRIVPGK